MALWDFLKRNNKGNTTGGAINIPLVQAVENDNGGLDAMVSQWQPRPTKMQQFKSNLADMLLGKRAQSTDTIGTQAGEPVTLKDEITGENITYKPQNISTISDNPRVGGLFNDITGGFKENLNNGFNINNFGQNTLSDGRQKGFGYRLGEGLGTAVRFLDSAPGRSLLTAGAVGLAGGDGADMLAYGLQGGALNNKLRTQDRMYRDEMLRNAQNSLLNSPQYGNMTSEEQQAALNNINEQINGMRGYVTPEMYEKFVNAQQLRENADWRKLYFDTQQQDRQLQREYQNNMFEWQKQKAEEDRAFRQQQLNSENYFKGQQIAQGWDRLNAEKQLQAMKSQGGGLSNSNRKTVTENMQTLADIDAGLKLIQENPNAYTWAKGIMGADLANRIDPKGVKTRTQIDNITAVYRKWLTGAQMSDQERKAYERFLPAPTDNAKIVRAKLQGMRDSIERKNNIIMGNYGQNDNNPLGLNL